MATARPNRVSTARKTSPMPPSPSLLSMRYGPRQAPAVNPVTVASSSSSGAFWMAGRSRNSPPVGLREQRLYFAAQFGIGLGQQRRALLGGCLASRMV